MAWKHVPFVITYDSMALCHRGNMQEYDFFPPLEVNL